MSSIGSTPCELEDVLHRLNAIHRVLHVGGQPAITIHAYSPPLVRMGAYRIGSAGELERQSLSYEQELRAA